MDVGYASHAGGTTMCTLRVMTNHLIQAIFINIGSLFMLNASLAHRSLISNCQYFYCLCNMPNGLVSVIPIYNANLI